MRILMLSPTIGESYGTEQVIRHCGEGLIGKGHEVFFLAEKLNGKPPSFSGGEIIDSLFSLNAFSGGEIKRVETSLHKIVSRIRPNVIHLMDELHPTLFRTLAHKAPLVLTSHTVATTSPSSCRVINNSEVCEKRSGWACFFHHHRYGCLSYLKNDLRRLHAIYEYQSRKSVHQKCQAVIGPSRYICDLLRDEGWKKIHCVPNPVPILERCRLPIPPENLMTVAARLVPMKGIDRLLRALSNLSTTRWNLWIFGDGPERNSLERLTVNLKIQSCVQFKGIVPQRDLWQAVASSTLFCQPNLGPESFGMAAAEAGALGIPVVGFDVPGLNETVVHNQTGMLVQRGNTDELAKVLKQLLESPETLKKLGNQAMTFIGKQFSLSRHLDGTLSVYERISGVPV